MRLSLFPWTPVYLGLGIGIWFALRTEPGPLHYAMLGTVGVASGAAALRWPGGWSALCWALALAVFGFSLAGYRAHSVAAPALSFRYYGPVEGRLVALDRSASDALRITLDHVRLDRVPPRRTPARVRLSLHTEEFPHFQPGMVLMTTGHLSPPSGPAESGGFDFRRHAWFQRLGAVGYTRSPVLTRAPPTGRTLAVRILTIRLAASERVRAVLNGDTGGFAAAVTTGDRSGVSQDALEALRNSNLAHLLAISGLHMGLLAGFVFGAVRLGIAAVPRVALRVPGHKVAALVALMAAAGYLALSGRNVATERAFIMVAVALLAVLTDRRALSLRAVATAAFLVLVLRPEALLSPGFQMSFAATTALVSVFGWLRDTPVQEARRWLRPVISLVISSAVAGAATGPVGAAHFNTMAHYGLVANLPSVPLMGFMVIPGAVLAVLLAPFGLEALGLWAMGLALDWILFVAHTVSDWPVAVGHVPQPPRWVLPVLALGLLWFMLSKERGSGFVAGIWLENDGDGASQPEAAHRWPDGPDLSRRVQAGAWEIVHLPGKRAVAGFLHCSVQQVVVAPVPLDLSGPCRVLDPKALRATGSLAVLSGKLVTAHELSGDRLWHQ